MNFSFKCISCGVSTFSLDSEALLYGGVSVATFICPSCKEHNSVQAGPNGSLVVATELPAGSKSSKPQSGA
jgi:hypothetical protein